MKSTILAFVFAAALSVEASYPGNNHHKSLLSFRSHKRHAALSASNNSTKMIKKRKTPGGGDSTTEPSNLAQGSYTAKQGCAVWHTVGQGEVCLGLIDKSSSGFNMDKFLKFNPSLNAVCDNLNAGQAYCVDTVVGGSAKAETPKAPAEVAPAKSLLADKKPPQADASKAAPAAEDDEEDCDDEEDDSAEDDEDCEEEDDDSADKVITVAKKVAAPVEKAPAPVAQPAKQNAPAPKAPEQKPAYVAPTSTYVAPSSTYTPPAPAPSPKPEQPKPEQPQQPSGGDMQYKSQPATYYMQNGNPGSCGDYNNDDVYIVAVKSGIMGSQLCGKSVKLRNTATGKEVVAKIADTCPTCENQGIDLSRGLFQALAPGGNLGLGVLNVDYSIL